MSRHCYQGTFKDQNGAVVGSSTTSDGNPGTVTVYLAGGTTLASVYTASSGGVAVNSVTTDAYGYFYFWVDDGTYTIDQLFKIVLTHPDFTTRTYDNISIILPTNKYIKDIVSFTSAVGDGATNNYDVLSAEISSLSTYGGKLIIPYAAASYKFGTKLSIPPNVLIIGSGRGATILEYTGSTIAVEFDSGTDAPVQFNSGLRDLTVLGKSKTGVGVQITDAYFVHLCNVTITNFATGLKSDSAASSFSGYVDLDNCYIHTNHRNVDLDGVANNIWNFNKGRIFLSSTYEGVLIQGDDNSKINFLGVGFESNVTSHVKMAGNAYGIKFDSYFETSYANAAAIQLTGAFGYYSINIHGSYFFQNHAASTASAIEISSTGDLRGIRINGNYNSGFGNTSGGGTGAFIDFGSKVFLNSDFTGNTFSDSVGLRYKNMPAATSNAAIVHRVTHIEQINFGSVNANDSAESTITGLTSDVLVRSSVHVTPLRLDGGAGTTAIEGGLIVTGYVDSEGSVKVRMTNATAGAIDPISRDYLVEITSY